MKKVFSLILAAVLLLGCFASAENKILTKIGVQQKLNQAFRDKAESVYFPVSDLLFNKFINDRLTDFTRMAWKAGIISYIAQFRLADHDFTITDLVYADAPLPYTEVTDREQFDAALKQYVDEKVSGFGILITEDGLRQSITLKEDADRYLFRHGMKSCMSGSNYSMVFFNNIVYAEEPCVEIEGFDAFKETVNAFRKAGINRFSVAFDPDTALLLFGENTSMDDRYVALLEAGILYTHDLLYSPDYGIVMFDVAAWTAQTDQDIEALKEFYQESADTETIDWDQINDMIQNGSMTQSSQWLEDNIDFGAVFSGETPDDSLKMLEDSGYLDWYNNGGYETITGQSTVSTEEELTAALKKAYEERAEEVQLHVTSELFSALTDDYGYTLDRLAWEAGIMGFDSSKVPGIRMIVMQNLQFAAPGLPCREVHSEEELKKAINDFADEGIATYGVRVPDAELMGTFDREDTFWKYAIRCGARGNIYQSVYSITVLDFDYSYRPVAEVTGIDGFFDAVASFRAQGINRFTIALDEETMNACFGEDVPDDDKGYLFYCADVASVNYIGFNYFGSVVVMDVESWYDSEEPQGNA